MHWNVPPDALPGSAMFVRVLDRWLNNWVLFVPGLSYSLLSVSKASGVGKVTRFSKSGCQIFNTDKVIVCASRFGSLYVRV